MNGHMTLKNPCDSER